MGDTHAIDRKDTDSMKKHGKIVILVDTKSNTPLLAYHPKDENGDTTILVLVDRYLRSTRFKKTPDHLKVQKITNYLRKKGYKPVDFEMKEI